jgi:hypothetical protein
VNASIAVSLAAGNGSENNPTLSVTSPADKPIARIEAMSISLPEFMWHQENEYTVKNLILCLCTLDQIV